MSVGRAPLLEVTLFGAPSFRWGDQLFTVERVQNRALLYRLAVELAPVARSELAFLFWPDVSDARSQRLLTQLLSHVRRALPDELLVTSKTHIQLDTQRVWSDGASFLALCRGGKQAPVANLQQAVELYRGPLLEGLSLADQPEYEVWLDGERARFERMHLESLDILIDRHSEQGQHAVAVEMARRYLAVDELAEGVHRRLIDSYAALGERTAAAAQYEECVRILERELGVPPLPETTAAYQQALVAPTHASAAAVHEPLWATLPGINTPLVGREQTLRALQAHFRESQNRHGHMVLLSGEAGIGKSRLMQELARSAQGEALIVAAACRPGVQSIPYQPLVEALRPLLRRSDIAGKVPNVWLQQLAVLFPEIENLGSAAPAAPYVGETSARSALFEALHQVMVALADLMPVLLCLDDLQWADTTTLQWLEYMARHIRTVSLLICGTHRSDEAENLADLLWEIKRLAACTEYNLSALEAGDVQQILEHLQIPQAAVLAARLRDVTGGNAFFLLETVQGLQETGQLTMAAIAGQRLPVSQTVRDAVKSRLVRLQPVARQILEAAAVWRKPIPFDALRQTAGRSELETVDGLDELVGRHIMLEQADRFNFHHDLARSVVYEELSHWRRRLLHRRTAEVLEAGLRGLQDSMRTGIVAEIGFHYVEAQETGRAINYLVEAGDYARNLYNHAAALDLYRQALAFLREHGDPVRIAHLLMKIGLTHHVAFDYPSAQVAFAEGFDFYQYAFSADQASRPAPALHPLRIVSPFPAPATWDPLQVREYHSFILVLQLFSGLVRVNPNLDIVPEAAERWEMLDGGRQYVFSLSEHACWSDGAPLTAHDFSAAWLRMLHPNTTSPLAERLYVIRGAHAYHAGLDSDPASVGIQVVDARTLAVTLEEPIGHFLHLLVHSSYMPIPRHIVERLGDRWMTTEPFVSNGPFVLERWNGEEIVLRRNSLYRGIAHGNVEQVICYSCEDWPAKLRMYEQGELDVLFLRHPPTTIMDRVRRRLDDQYVSFSVPLTEYLCFNTASTPFVDARVRQAFAMAIDKELLADVVLHGYPSPAVGSFTPPGMPGHLARPVLPHNPDRARKLLAQAGYAGGRGFPPIEWLVVTPAFAELADYLRDQWQRILNVDIPYEAVSWAALYDRLSASPPTMFIEGRIADYPDPDTYFCEGPIQLYSHYSDEVFDWLLQEARTTFDQARRIAVYEQLDRMIVEEAVLTPLVYDRMHALIKPWVKAFPFSPLSFWCWKDVVLGN